MKKRHPLLEVLYKCPQCGKPIELEDEFCSGDCHNAYLEAKEFSEHFPLGTDY